MIGREGKFIYVFDLSARDKLLSAGYQLLKVDKKQNIFIFANKKSCMFATNDFIFVLSDTFTF